MALLEIPVIKSEDAYEFSLSIESVLYFFSFNYNLRRKRWLMDISNADKEPILYGVSMLTDVDIMNRFKSEDLPPGIFLVFDLSGISKNPEELDFGESVILLYEESEAE